MQVSEHMLEAAYALRVTTMMMMLLTAAGRDPSRRGYIMVGFEQSKPYCPQSSSAVAEEVLVMHSG